PSASPGQCWAFHGAVGHVVIRLPENIWPVAVTVEHIPKSVSPTGEVSSAPKDFAVFVSLCFAPARREGATALREGRPLLTAPTLPLQKQLPRAFRFIKIQVQSNWGKREYTCLYRVQVHGMAARM
ncbi:SUN1 protein, partial [Nothoprocta ornata]|nr:SUN1 protein [Nothoprocta ornata]